MRQLLDNENQMVSANRQKAAIRQSQLSLISINEANQAVFASLLDPGDVILGLSLSCGGHLTHGAEPSLSGKWFRSIQYTVNRDTYLLDMDERPCTLWYSKRKGEEGTIILAEAKDLPMDPLKDLPKGYSKEEVISDQDVMDTWFTSAITPQLNALSLQYVMVIDPLVAWRLLSGARATAGLLSWAESVDRLLRIIGNAVYSFP
ncbi:Shmt protein [Dirofilaria immitis]|nr:Shmt protein [Dirofilaria immitis]